MKLITTPLRVPQMSYMAEFCSLPLFEWPCNPSGISAGYPPSCSPQLVPRLATQIGHNREHRASLISTLLRMSISTYGFDSTLNRVDIRHVDKPHWFASWNPWTGVSNSWTDLFPVIQGLRLSVFWAGVPSASRPPRAVPLGVPTEISTFIWDSAAWRASWATRDSPTDRLSISFSASATACASTNWLPFISDRTFTMDAFIWAIESSDPPVFSAADDCNWRSSAFNMFSASAAPPHVSSLFPHWTT